MSVRNASFTVPTRGRCRSAAAAAAAGTGRPGPSFLRGHLEYREPQRCGVGPLPPPSHGLGSHTFAFPVLERRKDVGRKRPLKPSGHLYTRASHVLASDHTHRIGSKLRVPFLPPYVPGHRVGIPREGQISRERRNEPKCPCGLRSTSESGMSARAIPTGSSCARLPLSPFERSLGVLASSTL